MKYIVFIVTLLVVGLVLGWYAGWIMGSENLLHKTELQCQSLLTEEQICQWELEHSTAECVFTRCHQYIK